MPLAYINIELLPLIIPTLVGSVYPSQLVDIIMDMSSELELTEDSI